MAFDSFGAPQFGLNDVKVATWNATNDYGEEVDVPSVQLLGITMRVQSAELEGDDEITASGSRVIGARGRLRFGSVSIAALEVLLGIASVASGSENDYLQIGGGDNLPYFGICGKALAEEGDGDFHAFLPKCKIMGDVELAVLQYGQFAIPEVEFMAVNDDTYDAINLIEHATAASVAIPPTALL